MHFAFGNISVWWQIWNRTLNCIGGISAIAETEIAWICDWLNVEISAFVKPAEKCNKN